MLAAPGFHHLHLNSLDPDRGDRVLRPAFPDVVEDDLGRQLPALAAPNDVLVLFTNVATPPPTSPQTAIWHFGWHVPDTPGQSRNVSDAGPTSSCLPLYTTDEGGEVFVSSDSWPSTGPTPGLTKAQIAEAKASGVQPTRKGGFGYMRGPDDALVEYAGQPSGRALQPRTCSRTIRSARSSGTRRTSTRPCSPAAPPDAPLTEATCTRAARTRSQLAGAGAPGDVPRAVGGRRVRRRGVAVVHAPGRAAARQLARAPLRPHRAQRHRPRRLGGQAARRGRAGSSRRPTKLGATRAVMIEGPSREALELVEVG